MAETTPIIVASWGRARVSAARELFKSFGFYDVQTLEDFGYATPTTLQESTEHEAGPTLELSARAIHTRRECLVRKLPELCSLPIVLVTTCEQEENLKSSCAATISVIPRNRGYSEPRVFLAELRTSLPDKENNSRTYEYVVRNAARWLYLVRAERDRFQRATSFESA